MLLSMHNQDKVDAQRGNPDLLLLFKAFFKNQHVLSH